MRIGRHARYPTGGEKLREMPRASSLSGYVWKTIFSSPEIRLRSGNRDKKERERERGARKNASFSSRLMEYASCAN